MCEFVVRNPTTVPAATLMDPAPYKVLLMDRHADAAYACCTCMLHASAFGVKTGLSVGIVGIQLVITTPTCSELWVAATQ